jgi:hypothetical protein
LFGIVDKNKEILLEVWDELTGKLGTRLTHLENTSEHISKEVLEFKSKIGGDVLTKLQSVEASLQLLEATAMSDASSPTFLELCHTFMTELIPATKDLWNLYILATEGPGKALQPGLRATPGGYLFTKLATLSDHE